MKTKVSVIIPVYNMEKYLCECIDSVINQTLKDIEIIVINDGSIDNSLNIIKEYCKKDNRIVVIDKNNEGVGKARNDGIYKAIGEYIAFLDPDDIYPTNNVLEVLCEACKKHRVSIAGGYQQRLLVDGSKQEHNYPIDEYGIKFSIKEGNVKYNDFQYDYGFQQYIYKRKIIVDNNILFPTYARFQDPPFFVKAMMCAGKFYYVNTHTHIYRLLDSNNKTSDKKTYDFICGLIDNLKISKENKLAKLHYLTVCRLFNDGSYMISNNINSLIINKIVNKYIQAISYIDYDLLNSNGYRIEEDYMPKLFEYLISTTNKYEKIRNRKIVKLVRRIK